MANSPSIFPQGALAARRSADLLIAWIDAADDAQRAYVAWRDARSCEQGSAFVVYKTAVDREEAAARALQREARRSARP